MDFTGKVALITGAGNGIGRAAAVGFAERGAHVVVVDRDQPAGEGTAGAIAQRGGESLFVAADVSRADDVRNYVARALERFGRIDCFFNNAGIEGRIAPTAEYDEDMFDAVIAVNVKGVFLGLRHVLPVMIRQQSGTVVNTASIAGLIGSAGMPAYGASKHAVLGLTKVAASDVARQGIRVNAVCPGPVETRMINALAAQVSPDAPESVNARYKASIPTGRFSTPEEIANMVLFLCSDLSGNVTGGQFVVDGGRIASPPSVTGMGARP